MSHSEKEYIIVLHRHEDLDQFYDDLESTYGDNEIPQRTVTCAYRRPLSRSTHYWLTDQEAAQVAQDSRVQSVTRPYQDLGMIVTPLTQQTSDSWDKSSTAASAQVNWALLRGYERVNRSGWGSDGTATVTGTIALNATGRDVDVVIIDGHLVPGHPEWAVNLDGSGSTRLIQFNWFQYNSQVRSVAAGTYQYDFTGSSADHDHGNNVGSIAVGSSCGWAKQANIYNICPYTGSTANASGYSNYLYDLLNYIRVWHANKSINPRTGLRNPTVCNMSFGFTSQVVPSNVLKINYRGVDYTAPSGGWTSTERIYTGLVASAGSNWAFASRDASMDADCQDCVSDGIILVGAAGNSYMFNDLPGGSNYNNYLRNLSPLVDMYFHRGPSPGCATGVICVSAVDSTVSERKVDFSNGGPRTDILAAGTNIMGASYTNQVLDPRNSSFYKRKNSGTSQASPQVAGLAACLLETYPRLTPAEVRDRLRSLSPENQLSGSANYNYSYGSGDFPYLQYNSLWGGSNIYAAYTTGRSTVNQTYPNNFYNLRTSQGRQYPRPRVRRF